MIYEIGEKVQLKKKHPCGSDIWTIVRLGADVKLKCDGCNKVVMLTTDEFKRRIKKYFGKENG